MIRLGVDIGGTFTDFALRLDDGRTRLLKLPTTPRAPEEAVIAGTRRLLAECGLAPSSLAQVVHGTTLVTNALIERKGARIAFVTTEGFRDTLEMGYESRHDHYDLDLVRPAPLVPRDLRFTLPERVSAAGETILPLDPAAVEALVPRLAAAGVEAVAVGFLHAWRDPAHERLAGRILGERGGWPVSLSSEVAPEIREFERFSTACVNAYVQPLVAGYVSRLSAGLQALGVRGELLLMLSDGALATVDTATRYPVRLLESGPAGGAILAAAAARRCGIEQALMVDIGGTTAKFCFIDDGQPQTARTMEAARLERFKAGSGVPLRLPVVELAEIGAGGGSIVRIDALDRLAAGPESAGAEPGPAAYGRGGSAPTITDAHLLLGRLDEAGLAGGQVALDAAASSRAFAPLAARRGETVEATALAACDVVDENMATAARAHAAETARGLVGRVLVALGGMAPLHAAALAARLEIDRVLVPAGAGVGSALGFLEAPIAFEASFGDARSLAGLDAAAVLERLARGSAELREIVGRAAPGREITEQRAAWMRYRGQGHEIRVALDGSPGALAPDALRGAFERAYLALYGRGVEGAPIELVAWTVRVSAPATAAAAGGLDAASAGHAAAPAGGVAATDARGPRDDASPAADTGAASPATDTDAGTARRHWDQATRRPVDAPVLRAAGLAGRVDGPALVAEDETTLVVPPGWRCERVAGGDLLLTRVAARAAAGAMPHALRMQLLWDRLIAIAEEQARTLMRTAFSPTVREAGDLSAGLFDAEGRLIAQAVTGTPGHVNSMAASAEHFVRAFPPATLRPGDQLVTNDPWLASGHMHDVTVFSPVFHRGALVGFFACTCHQVDIGGLGQGPDAQSVYEEGLRIPPMHLAREGRINEDLLRIVRANVRQPEVVVGDILSYVTAAEVASRRLSRLLDELDEPDLARVSAHIRERSHAGMVAAIAALPRGGFEHELRLDGYDAPVTIRCRLSIAADHVAVDFDGSSPASTRGINLVLNYTRAYAAFGVRAAIAPHVPNNAGSLAAVRVEAPEGSILNVRPPAPVAARHIIGQFLPEATIGALAKAMPGRLPAEGAACNWGLQLRGRAARTRDTARAAPEPFEILFFNAGGCGARPGLDGLSATAFPSGIRAIPVEICELAAPIVIERKELLPGSGGAGRHRGGLGQRVEVRTLDGSAFQVFGIFDRVRHPARGSDGGQPGRPGRIALRSGAPLASMGLQTVPAGEVLRIDLPGGGGHGDPARRDPASAERDRRLGYLEAADAAGAGPESTTPRPATEATAP